MTLYEALGEFSTSMHEAGVRIGDAFAYTCYSRSIDRLRRETELLPLFSWRRYTNRREIQRLTKLKSEIEKRRGE